MPRASPAVRGGVPAANGRAGLRRTRSRGLGSRVRTLGPGDSHWVAEADRQEDRREAKPADPVLTAAEHSALGYCSPVDCEEQHSSAHDEP
jgi:hypothetical protein